MVGTRLHQILGLSEIWSNLGTSPAMETLFKISIRGSISNPLPLNRLSTNFKFHSISWCPQIKLNFIGVPKFDAAYWVVGTMIISVTTPPPPTPYRAQMLVFTNIVIVSVQYLSITRNDTSVFIFYWKWYNRLHS